MPRVITGAPSQQLAIGQMLQQNRLALLDRIANLANRRSDQNRAIGAGFGAGLGQGMNVALQEKLSREAEGRKNQFVAEQNQLDRQARTEDYQRLNESHMDIARLREAGDLAIAGLTQDRQDERNRINQRNIADRAKVAFERKRDAEMAGPNFRDRAAREQYNQLITQAFSGYEQMQSPNVPRPIREHYSQLEGTLAKIGMPGIGDSFSAAERQRAQIDIMQRMSDLSSQARVLSNQDHGDQYAKDLKTQGFHIFPGRLGAVVRVGNDVEYHDLNDESGAALLGMLPTEQARQQFIRQMTAVTTLEDGTRVAHIPDWLKVMKPEESAGAGPPPITPKEREKVYEDARESLRRKWETSRDYDSGPFNPSPAEVEAEANRLMAEKQRAREFGWGTPTTPPPPAAPEPVSVPPMPNDRMSRGFEQAGGRMSAMDHATMQYYIDKATEQLPNGSEDEIAALVAQLMERHGWKP